ncbi:MAG: DUF1489 domain-containing protein [Pseudomonadota bacterium]
MSDSGDLAKLHLLKLSVGSENVDTLRKWQKGRSDQRIAAGLDPRPRHVTRMWPRREAEILTGGSIYWVIARMILARQTIEEFEEVIGEDGIRRCGIVLNPEIVRVEPRPKGPFQGWRYLKPEDAPKDLDAKGMEEAKLPEELRSELVHFGVLGG